jgi:hypothetical protein
LLDGRTFDLQDLKERCCKREKKTHRISAATGPLGPG